MSQLTDEQIEAAAKEGYSAANNQFQKSGIAHQYSMKQTPWNELAEVSKDMWRVAVRYAAPFLQMPLAIPTYEEMKNACYDFNRSEPRNNTYAGVPTGLMMDALTGFVARRNAALIPKPIDPRREKIIRVMEKELFTMGHNTGQAVDAILAALDAKE